MIIFPMGTVAAQFLPHGHCYLWNFGLIGLHVASDFLIALAYYSISIALIYFVSKRTDLPYPSLFLLFGAFIISCGTIHLMEIWTIWHPHYWVSGALKALTALIGLYTTIELFYAISQALILPSPTQLETANQQLEREVNNHQQTEAALRESEDRFRRAFDNAAIGVALVAPDGRWLKVNHSLCEIVGYSESELLALTFQDITHPDDLEADLNYMRQMLAGEIRTYQLEKRYFHKLGHEIWILLSVSLVYDNKDRPLYFIAQIQDITARKQAEQALQEEKSILRSFYDSAPMMMGVVELGNEDVRHLADNTATAAFFGVTAEAMQGQWASQMGVPKDILRLWIEHYRQSKTTDKPVRFEYIHSGTNTQYLSATVSTIIGSTQFPRFSYVIEDISDRQQGKEKLEKSLQEKEILLKAIHHQVKNNLQIICSLLNLQSRSLKEQKIAQHFRATQNRVKTMALLHEQLYQSPTLAQVSLSKYLQQLTGSLFLSYATSKIDLETKLDDCLMDVDTALPCGLIVNELLSNAIKYAFTSTEKGKLFLETSIEHDQSLVLIVRDNGKGFPANFVWEESKSLGLSLVKSLIEQLQGNLEMSSTPEDGTQFTFTLKKINK